MHFMKKFTYSVALVSALVVTSQCASNGGVPGVCASARYVEARDTTSCYLRPVVPVVNAVLCGRWQINSQNGSTIGNATVTLEEGRYKITFPPLYKARGGLLCTEDAEMRVVSVRNETVSVGRNENLMETNWTRRRESGNSDLGLVIQCHGILLNPDDDKHGLKRFIPSQEKCFQGKRIICNNCTKRTGGAFTSDMTFYGCRVCDWDVCCDCYFAPPTAVYVLTWDAEVWTKVGKKDYYFNTCTSDETKPVLPKSVYRTAKEVEEKEEAGVQEDCDEVDVSDFSDSGLLDVA